MIAELPASFSISAFSSAGVVELGGNRLQPRREGWCDELAPQREIVDQNERLLVPEIRVDRPAEKRADVAPRLGLLAACSLRGRLRIEHIGRFPDRGCAA